MEIVKVGEEVPQEELKKLNVAVVDLARQLKKIVGDNDFTITQLSNLVQGKDRIGQKVAVDYIDLLYKTGFVVTSDKKGKEPFYKVYTSAEKRLENLEKVVLYYEAVIEGYKTDIVKTKNMMDLCKEEVQRHNVLDSSHTE